MVVQTGEALTRGVAARGKHVERRDQLLAQRGALDDAVDHAGGEHFLTAGGAEVDQTAGAGRAEAELRGWFGEDDVGVIAKSGKEGAGRWVGEDRDEGNPVPLQATDH